MARNANGRARKIGEKQLALRGQLWPTLTDEELWHRKQRDGFVTIPRGMPLILDIMDDLSKGRPVSSTYLELWCRAFDEYFVTLSKPTEMAFHAGFTGQRAARTWMQRMDRLQELGFVSIQPGPSGPMSYALILNPYKVIQRLFQKRMPGLLTDKYNALVHRTIEIGANDLTETPPVAQSQEAPATSGTGGGELDDDIPF